MVTRVRGDRTLPATLPARGLRRPSAGRRGPGAGFVAALQFAEDKATRKRFANENDLAWRCRTIGFEEGVIIRSTLGRMIMAPALVAGRAEIDELIDKTRIAVDRTAREIGVL